MRFFFQLDFLKFMDFYLVDVTEFMELFLDGTGNLWIC